MTINFLTPKLTEKGEIRFFAACLLAGKIWHKQVQTRHFCIDSLWRYVQDITEGWLYKPLD